MATAAFLVSPRLGLLATAAVIVHEVPEEVAECVLLRKAGVSRTRALLAMTGVQRTATIGAVLTLLGAAVWTQAGPVVLAVAAGTFWHRRGGPRPDGHRQRRAETVLAFVLGIAIAAAVTFL